MRRRLLLAALLLAVCALAPVAQAAAPPRPQIVWKPIPYGPKRKVEMAAYARRHYGIDSYRLRPHVLVEHYTGNSSFLSAYRTFAQDVRDSELNELPGLCAHFVIDRDGTIYQLVPLTVMCRHAVGLNYAAIGIEHVAGSDAQVLENARQLRSSLALTLWLAWRYRIRLANVIGHNESLSSPYHRELIPAWRCQTHGDWRHADMLVYRRRLSALARSSGVALGSESPYRPRC